MISDTFIFDKKDSTNKAVSSICEIILGWSNSFKTIDEQIDNYEEYIDAYAALESFLESKNIEIKPIIFDNDKEDNVNEIIDYIDDLHGEFEKRLTYDTLEKARTKHKAKFGVNFSYEFTDNDLKRIQKLINELREKISSSELFVDNHKERLLKRLEKMQLELHKRVSSLDKFWGLVGDAGIVLGKFGEDAKPFVDRIKEITQIIWKTQTSAEALPTGTKIPLIGDKE